MSLVVRAPKVVRQSTPAAADARPRPRPVPGNLERPEPPVDPAGNPDATPEPGASAPQPPPRSRKKTFAGGVAVAALMATAWYGYDYWTVGRFIVSTDDAYVGADMATLAPKVAAHVARVAITDNQAVKAGDLLVSLDAGDYALAVESARTKLDTQRSRLATIDAQIAAAKATAAQAKAQQDAGQAALVKAEADFTRASQLAEREYASRATLDATRAARDSARAQVQGLGAAIATAEANVAVLQAQRMEAEKTTAELQVALDKAQRDLSFTEIRAPFDGVIGNKSVQVGDYVTPGKRLAAIVPLDRVYIDANLKETQLARIRPGEPVKVRIDAWGGETIEGRVESIAPASGARFSLLPPENATGNFTKIVQRVPVRIRVPAEKAAGRLRSGLSVVVDIDTRPAPDNQGAVE